MSKTATIKLRLTEAEKTAWEAQATADGVSLSSLIRRRMNHPVVRADGELVPARVAALSVSGGNVFDYPWLGKATDVPHPFQPPEDRRTTECEHGRPQYVFCSTCD